MVNLKKQNAVVFKTLIMLFAIAVTLPKTSCISQALENISKANSSTYIGYEVSAGTRLYSVQSNISKINRLDIASFGGRVGGILGNTYGKVRGGLGLYYSDSSLPYSFDLLKADINVTVFPLRLSAARYHTFEPYVLAGVSQRQTSFFGWYLSEDTRRNYSQSKEQLVGKVNSTQCIAGLGIEFQMENDRGNFMHFFAEVSTGIPLNYTTSTSALEETRVARFVNINVGLSMGIVKN